VQHVCNKRAVASTAVPNVFVAVTPVTMRTRTYSLESPTRTIDHAMSTHEDLKYLLEDDPIVNPNGENLYSFDLSYSNDCITYNLH